MKFKNDLNEVMQNLEEAYRAHVDKESEEESYEDYEDTAAKMFIIPKLFDSTEN